MEQVTLNQDAYEETVLKHPWIRYFARMLDLRMYGILWVFLQRILLRWHISNGLGQNLVDIVAAIALMLLFEPLFLHILGTTPGKWVFGLSFRTQDEEKLGYSQAFLRTLEVWRGGMGFRIPIYNLVRLYKSYSQCKRGEPMLWDEGLDYRIRDTKGWRIAAFIGVSLVFVALTVLVMFEAQLPPNRGNITPAQYAENVNDARARVGYRDGLYMTEACEWAEKERVGTIIYSQPTEPSKHELIIENGLVVGVRLHGSADEEWIGSYWGDKMFVAFAFLGAQPGMSGVRFSDPIFQRHINDALNSYSFEIANVRITNTVESNGYQGGKDYLLADGTQEGKRFYNMTFEMLRLDSNAANP